MLSSGNSELRADGIFTWSIPALATKLNNGLNFLTCPNAGACATLCYARNGTYNFSNVKAAHVRNLESYLNDPDGWIEKMKIEISKKKYRPTGKVRDLKVIPADNFAIRWIVNGGKAIRIHDSGDFFSREYLEAWIDVVKSFPDVMFYAYTKEVEMLKGYELPDNFRIIFSMGGKQDHLINKDQDRHAEVFPTMEALTEAGYTDQEDSDLLAFLLPTAKIGIVVNNIPHYKKKQGSATFGELQKLRG
jgi:hypothetical protein